MQRFVDASRRKAGFNLVELAVVIVIIGVLAAFGVPRFMKSVERSKAVEAFEYLAAIRTSQERYQSQYGTYATHVSDLDIIHAAPKYFAVPATFAVGDSGNLQNSWMLTLTRTGSSAGYGAYTVTFTEDGFDAASGALNINTLPDINPISY